MKRAVLADTGPLYAAVDPDDQHHTQAQQELGELQRRRLTVMLVYPTLSETYTLVLYRLGRSTARSWLQEILQGGTLINPTPEDYRVAVSKIEAYPDQPITLFDATLAVLSKRLSVPVWTYDHHFDVMRAAVWR
jgi:predicted nucleic acid-binding protein